MAFRLTNSLFRMTRTFPKEERYSLTDQVLRSSRSGCANLAECYGRRAYRKHYQSKLSDCAAENFETQVRLSIALSCGYIDAKTYDTYLAHAQSIGKLLTYMQRHADNFLANTR